MEKQQRHALTQVRRLLPERQLAVTSSICIPPLQVGFSELTRAPLCAVSEFRNSLAARPKRLTRDSLPYNHGMQSRMSLPKVCRLAAFLLMLWVSLGASAQAPGAGPLLIVTYVEAPPAKGAALAVDLHAYAGQIENGRGKPRVTVLREFGCPNRMVIIEQWPDSSSPAFAKSETELAAMVQPDVRAPMDRRVNHPLTPALTPMAATRLHYL